MKTRAAVLRESPGKWNVEELDLSECGAHEVQVRIEAAGLCHSDDHFATGDTPSQYLPIIGGHEGAGVVTAVGSAVERFVVGDHVITTFMPACGHCRFCATGRANLCDEGARIMAEAGGEGRFKFHDAAGVGVGQMTMLGTFSEYTVVSELSLIKVDSDVPFTSACLLACGVPTGWGAAEAAGDIQTGDVVIVMGVGGIGIHSVQAAALRGAAHVIAVDPVAFKRSQAVSVGATQAFAHIAEAADRARELTNGQGADATMISVGVLEPSHVAEAFASIRKAGTVVVTSLGRFDAVGIPVNLMELALYQKRIQGALYGTLAPVVAVPKFISMYKAGKLKLDELVTRTYSLDEVNEAYADMHAGTVIRAVITMSG